MEEAIQTNLDLESSGTTRASSRTGPRRAMLARIGRQITSLSIFVTLGGLLLWGHHTGWTMPKFSSLASATKADGDADDNGWCSEHNVPESQCIECNADLLPKPKCLGWCKTHGVHDCPICHPEVAQVHGQPPITAESLPQTKRAHLDDCQENNSACTLHERRIQFASMEAVQKAGVEVAAVGTAAITESVSGNGEVGYDQTRFARISSRLPGSVHRVFKQSGDPVNAGELIALVDAVEVGRAKSELLHALVTLRLKTKTLEVIAPLESRGEIPKIQVREAEAAVSEARIRLATAQQSLANFGLSLPFDALKNISEIELAERLRVLGIPKSLRDERDATASGNLLPIYAPLDGTVVSREAVAGETVDSAKVLFMIADTRTMWLSLDVRLEDARRVELGQEVRFTPDGGQQASGRVTWISTEADNKTRTVKVRASLTNADGRLRANVFGTGRIVVHTEGETVVVPNAAVQWEGCCHVVFVRDKDFLLEGGPKVFHVRSVHVGARSDTQTEILAGLLPGEVVATAGSSLLRAELLKGDLGEGCACCKK
jgi:cobalt-zinc-cadmium efflux system membrane fusion protein